jgi:hypothetical protein
VSSDTNQKERGAERKAHQGTEMLRLLRECQAKEMPRNAEKKTICQGTKFSGNKCKKNHEEELIRQKND